MKLKGWGKKNPSPKPEGRRGLYTEEFRNDKPLDTTFRSGATLKTFHVDDHEKSERQKKQDLRARRRKIGVILVTIAVICSLGLIVLLQYSGSFNSFSSNAPTLSKTDSDKYRTIVSEYFANNPFERFIFGRRDQNLNNFVSDRAPEVESVKVSISGLMTSKLTITFRQPVVMWSSGAGKSYVDKNGVVFSVNYFSEPNVSISDKSGVVADDDMVTSSNFLSFVGQVTSEIDNDSDFSVEKVVIPSGAIRYVEFYLTGHSYPFKAQIDRNASSQANDIIAMAKYIDANSLYPSYVDVRISGKAYWK